MRNSKLDHPREYYSYWKAEHIEPEMSVSKALLPSHIFLKMWLWLAIFENYHCVCFWLISRVRHHTALTGRGWRRSVFAPCFFPTQISHTYRKILGKLDPPLLSALPLLRQSRKITFAAGTGDYDDTLRNVAAGRVYYQ